MEQINLTWFAAINAGANLHGFQLWLALFLAKYLVIVILLGLILLGLRGNAKTRYTLCLAFAACILALFFNWIISLAWYHPRPFVLGVGHTFLHHAPDSSFPSDHASALFALSFVFLGQAQKLIGFLLLFATVCVVWARVYVGVHFPFDILASMIVSLLAALVVIYGNKLYICKRNQCNMEILKKPKEGHYS